KAIVLLILLASISGGIPLFIYFEGLRLTRASTAGYFEMMQTLAAVCITWGFFHASLHSHQVIAAIILISAVAIVHHVQQPNETRSICNCANQHKHGYRELWRAWELTDPLQHSIRRRNVKCLDATPFSLSQWMSNAQRIADLDS